MRLSVSQFLNSCYVPSKIALSEITIEQYRIAVRQFDLWNGEPVMLDQLTEELLIGFLRSRRSEGKSARTVNNSRQVIIMLWRAAYRRRNSDNLRLCPTPAPDTQDVGRLKEVKRMPTAWTLKEMARIISACEAAPVRSTWGVWHWRALILTQYDTSLRIGCLLKVERSALAGTTLVVPGELQKQSVDTSHQLHQQTIDAIERMPSKRLLFPWPVTRRAIWPELKQILVAAGLPFGRRDMFHRFRRTSYTMVYSILGGARATEHAGHSCDLSDVYLDRTKLSRPSVIDSLPRPI